MPGKSPGPSIKNPKVYEALKRKGFSKAKAAAISNAQDDDDIADGASIEWLTRDKEFSAERRKTLAKSGAAMAHGGYPIENESDLKNAIQAFGRAKNKSATKAHIKKRAAALGKTNLLPENWDGLPGWAWDSGVEIRREWFFADTKACPTCGGDGVMPNGNICTTCDGHGSITPAQPYVQGIGPAGPVNVSRAVPAAAMLNHEPEPEPEPEPRDNDDDERRKTLQAIAKHVRFSKKIQSLVSGLPASLEDKRKPPDDDDDDDDDDDFEDTGTRRRYRDSMQLVIDGGNVIRKTADGYLVASARIARSGIQIYDGRELGRPDMGMVRVYRPADEVFSSKAMRTLAHKPITFDHPPQMVDAKNWKKHAIGHIGDEVTRDGDTVRVPMVIMDGNAVRAYERDGVKELSVGYSTELKWESGTTPAGEAYDAKQTAIRGNHLALVPSARGGSRLRIGDDHQKGDRPMVNVLIDGHSIEFENELAAKHVQAHIGALQKQVEDARKGKDKKNGNGDDDDADEEQEREKKERGAKDAAFAAMKGENAALKKQLEDAQAKSDAKAIDAQVKERIDLLMKADALMDGKGQFDGKSDEQIRREVITASMGDAGKALTDAEVIGAFKYLAANVKPRSGTDRLADSLSLLGRGGGGASSDPRAIRDAAYDKYCAGLQSAWKTKPGTVA